MVDAIVDSEQTTRQQRSHIHVTYLSVVAVDINSIIRSRLKMAESAGVYCPMPSEQDNVEQAKGNPALDSSTFIPPAPLMSPSIIIEFCDRVRGSACCNSLL